MAQYIDKDTLVAEIERLKDELKASDSAAYVEAYIIGAEHTIKTISNVIDTLEVKEVGADIPNIDNLLKEDGIDPDSKEAKIFKESYYSALEKLKEKIV